MDRDKIFIELLKGLMSNSNVVKHKQDLNYRSGRTQIIDMAKLMTNLAMKEIEVDEVDEREKLD